MHEALGSQKRGNWNSGGLVSVTLGLGGRKRGWRQKDKKKKIQGHPWLSGEFKASLSYLKSCLKTQNCSDKNLSHLLEVNKGTRGVGEKGKLAFSKVRCEF